MSNEKQTISSRIKRKGEATSILIVLGATVLVGSVFFFGGIGSQDAKFVQSTEAGQETPAE